MGIFPEGKPPTRPHGFFMSVPTYYVCPHLLCLSPPIMSVPTYHVCPHISCLSPPIMSVPTFHVCPHLLCLSPPIIATLGSILDFHLAENLASSSLQGGAMKWYYFLQYTHPSTRWVSFERLRSQHLLI